MQLLSLLAILLFINLSYGEDKLFCTLYWEENKYDRIPPGCMFCAATVTPWPAICNCSSGSCVHQITEECPTGMKCSEQNCSAKCVKEEAQVISCKRNFLINLHIPWHEAKSAHWSPIDDGKFKLVDHDKFNQGNWCKSCNGPSTQTHEIIYCQGNDISILRCPLNSRCADDGQECNAFCLGHGFSGLRNSIPDWNNSECYVTFGNQNGVYYAQKGDGCIFCDRYKSQDLDEISQCYNGEIRVAKCEQSKQCNDYDSMCSASCHNSYNVKYVKMNKTEENTSKPKFSMATYIIAFIVVVIIFTFIIILILCRNRNNSDDEKILMEEIIDTSKNPDMSPLNLITMNQLNFNINTSKKLGEGAFGSVYTGKYILPNNKKFPVAIKVIKCIPNDKKSTEKETIEEATIMARLNHENLLRLIGICLADGIQIVTPLRPLGSLDKFLKEKKDLLRPQNLMLYAYQIASAMEYLSSHKIVHRDLAARNVLIKKFHHIEVTDFGLASLLGEKTRTPNRLPYRWVSIECLINNSDPGLYCETSDVWSFGITVWEILTFAKIPYENVVLDSRNVLQSLYLHLKDGNRLYRPSNCGIELYKTLLLCWASNPDSRPNFSNLKETFEQYKNAPYAYVKPSNEENSPESLNGALDSDEKQLSLIYDLLGKDDYLFNENLLQQQISYDHIKANIEQNNFAPKHLAMRPYRRFSNDSYFYTKESGYSIPNNSRYELLNQYNKLRKCNTYCDLQRHESDK